MNPRPKPSRRIQTRADAFLFISSFAMLFAWLYSLRVRDDLTLRFGETRFVFEGVSWLLSFLVAGSAAYFSLIPDALGKHALRLALIPFGFLMVSFLFHPTATSPLASEWAHEMNLWRGRCGFNIFAGSAIIATPLLFFAKSQKATQRLSGALILLAAGSFCGLWMQVLCAYDNSLHLFLWHLLPIPILTGVGFGLGKFFVTPSARL